MRQLQFGLHDLRHPGGGLLLWHTIPSYDPWHRTGGGGFRRVVASHPLQAQHRLNLRVFRAQIQLQIP